MTKKASAAPFWSLGHSGLIRISGFGFRALLFGFRGLSFRLSPRAYNPGVAHIVLLGDSIFDNASYVPGGPAVVEQLRGKLQRGWRASLLAVDGAVCDSVGSQLRRLPEDATHLFVS